MVLTALATGRRAETDVLTRCSAGLFPRTWARFRDGVPADRRDGDLAAAYNDLLGDPDPAVRERATRNWCAWEDALVSTAPPFDWFAQPGFAYAFARIVTHYWRHGSWLDELVVVHDAGHDTSTPGVAESLVAATDRFA